MRVTKIEPRPVFAGTTSERDIGDKYIVFEYESGSPTGAPYSQSEVGVLRMGFSQHDTLAFPVGTIVSLEICIPPAKPLYFRDAGASPADAGAAAVRRTLDHALNSGDGSYRP